MNLTEDDYNDIKATIGMMIDQNPARGKRLARLLSSELSAREQRDIAIAALKWYADEDAWKKHPYSTYILDAGERARNALSQINAINGKGKE
jgi:hypothetical protein